jgi:ketosteroid isomerase-like protein
MISSTIEQKYQEFGKYMQSGDIDGLVQNLYTEDCKIYPPDGGVATGRKGVSEFVSGLLASGMIVMIQPEEVEKLGDAVYDYGMAKVSNPQGEEVGIQRYMVIWKKEEGKWKIYRDFIKTLEEV